MTEESSVASRKRKRVSKNKKKTWRKTDVQDVEEYLEDQRFQERTGGIVAEKTDEALFFVDTTKKSAISKPLSKKQRWGNKPLKCVAHLEPDPNIKPARSHHNVKQKATRLNPAAQERISQGLLTAQEKHAQTQREEATLSRQQRKKQKTSLPSAGFDLWTNKKSDEPANTYHLRQTKKLPVKIPAHHRDKPSDGVAIEMPHPGASYNPTYDDHQDLLRKAVKVEDQKRREYLKLKRALDDKFPRGADAPTAQTWLDEMSAGLATSKTVVTEDTEETEVAANPPVRREDKKTRQERRKQNERKALQKTLLQEKEDKKRNNTMFRLKGIKSEIRCRDDKLSEKQRRKESIKLAQKDQPKKLGKLKYQEPNIDVKMTDELAGSLRLLRPEGDLLHDRFKSLQRRNMIESRERAKFVRRYKRKKYVKNSHKDIPE